VSRKPGTAQLYRRILVAVRTHAGPLLVMAVVVFVPLSLFEALGERALELDLEDLTAFEAGALTAAWLFQIASSLVGEVFYAGAVAALLVGERTGVERRPRDVVRELPYVRLVSVDLLYSLGVAVFFILLIVPGVLFFTYYALTAPVVEIEERGIRAAFRRSRELVRGSAWTVLAILLPITVVIELLAQADQAGVNALLGHSLLADWLGGLIANILVTPLYAVAAVVLTIELIGTKGGRLAARSPASQ
jgi:hypothetical protein